MKKIFFCISFLYALVTLAQQYQGSFIGISSGWSNSTSGVIFSTNLDTLQELAAFENDNNGVAPYGLVEVGNGKFYGVTGGSPVGNSVFPVFPAYSGGLIYEYDKVERKYTEKASFTVSTGGNCKAGLIQATNGNLYGMAYYGGINNKGTLYKFDMASSTLTKMHDFDSITGRWPDTELIEHCDGFLYGITYLGGVNDKGVLFRFDPNTEIFSKILDFGNTPCGRPGVITSGSDGKLYGLSAEGAFNMWSIFSVDLSTNTVTKLYDFNFGFNGGYPVQGPVRSLIEVAPGKFVGAGFNLYTSWGPSKCIFEYNVGTNQFRIRERLKYSNIENVGPLTYDSAGYIYSSYDYGVFRFNCNLDTVDKKNGGTYYGKLIHGSDGILYGVSQTNGLSGGGFMYKVNPLTLANAKIAHMNWPNQGKLPRASMCFDSVSGKMYGACQLGGLYNNGTFFEFDPYTNEIKRKADFSPEIGFGTTTAPIITPNHTLLGVASDGGSGNGGTIYEFNPMTGATTLKQEFGGIGPEYQSSGLVAHPNGKYYGVSGGDLMTNNNKGTLYEYNYTLNTITVKVLFDGLGNGEYPSGELILGPTGDLYGHTWLGGLNGFGVLYKYNPVTDTLIKIHDFGMYPEDAKNPQFGSMVFGINNKLYGTSRTGGSIGGGTIFEYDPLLDTIIIKFNFGSVASGYDPYGSLLEKDGKIYSYVRVAGPNNTLSIFSYDYINDVYTKEIDSDSTFSDFTDKLMYVCLPPRISTPIHGGDFCLGQQIELIVNAQGPDLSYQWQKNGINIPGGNSPIYSINSSIADSAVYHCLVSNYCGIVSTDTVTVEVHPVPPPIISVSASALNICEGDSLVLLASSGDSINWNNNVINGVAFLPTVTSAYIATAINTYGCQVSDTITVLVNNYPSIISLPDLTVCSLSSVVLNAVTNTVNYSWSNGINNGVPFTPQTAEYVLSAYINPACEKKDTVNITVDPSCQLVYPGDVNNDGIADNNDVLELGLYFGATGGTRVSVTNLWQGYPAPLWGTDTVSSGYNLNHADCNGDGIINLNDTLAINLNYGLTHALRLADINKTNTTGDIYFSSAQLGYGAGQQVAIDVYLGESTNPLQNFYGAAFTIDYNDNTLVQPGSLKFSIDNASWVGTINTDAIRLTKPMEASETIDAAICKTNHINTSGAGKIGTLRFIASNTIGNFSVTASNAYYIDNAAIQTPLTSATYTVNINTAVGLQNQTSNSNISIYPNPNNGSFTLSNLNTREEYKLEVKDVLGRTVYADVIKSNSSKANIKLNQEAGVYWLQLTPKQGETEVHKVVVE